MPRLNTTLKQVRQNAGMTQSELAALVGVRRETIIRLEAGAYNPSLKLALDITHVFDTTIENLFSFDD